MRVLLRSTVVLFVLINAIGLYAQRVSNVTAEQQGQELVISYALEADGPVAVDLFVSTDQGKNWLGPLSNCSGDVGKNVLSGARKLIRWAVLEERELVGEAIRFKVVARTTSMERTNSSGRPWLNPELSYGSVTDIDGNIYATIQIGKQVWMAENLRTTRYRNGDPIPNVTEGDQWADLGTGAWAHYENKSQQEVPYGKLYNWYVVADPRNACPAGWHIPSDAEWTNLTNYLGGETIAGGKLKATTLWDSSFEWDSPNGVDSKGSGFSGLPGGARGSTKGSFYDLGTYGSWWSASESDQEYAWSRSLYFDNADIIRYYGDKRNGLCLRCVRD